MKKLDIYYAYWLLSRIAKNLGTWGVLGIAIVMGSLLFYMVQVKVLEQEISMIQLELHQARIKPMEFKTETAPVQTSAQEVSDFYKSFSNGASLPKWLSLIEQSALKQHLTLNHGDYKLSQTKQGQLLRYEIILPVVGKYTQVRQFIGEVLKNLPVLALIDVQIKRENSLSPTVEARLVFVLYLQAGTW